MDARSGTERRSPGIVAAVKRLAAVHLSVRVGSSLPHSLRDLMSEPFRELYRRRLEIAAFHESDE